MSNIDFLRFKINSDYVFLIYYIGIDREQTFAALGALDVKKSGKGWGNLWLRRMGLMAAWRCRGMATMRRTCMYEVPLTVM
jgi:hypothetical protein